MKKTIAKIMAAAMVLSTITAPNAFAATYEGTNYATNTKVKLKNFSIGDTVLWADGVRYDNALDLQLDSTVFTKTATGNLNAIKPADDTYTFAGKAGGTTKVSKLSFYGAGAQRVTFDAVTPTDVKSDTATYDVLVKEPSTSKQVEIEKAIMEMISDGVAEKVTVNGEYNDLVVADDLSSWYWIVFDNRGNFTPRFNWNWTKFSDWTAKLLNRGVITGRTWIVDNNGNRLMPWTGTISIRNWGTTTDDYWNGIVKLKASNNRYTPIRVHCDADTKSVAGANLGLFAQVVNNTTIQGVNWATGALTISALSNRRMHILDVNEYDLEILKSDYAKGKNLMLDKVYVFATADPLNDNGFYSAMTGWEDYFNLGVDTDLGTVAIGKIDTIHARLFKECKEKYVDAQYAKFINNGAFRKNKQLKKARIGDEKNIKKINEKAFYDCKKLATVKLSGKALKRVGKDAFKKCKNNILFKIKGNDKQVKRAAKMLLKQAPAKARYAKI